MTDGSMRILVVDDSPSFREMLTMILKNISPDLRVEHASDGPEARASVATFDYDLIFLGVNLPGKDGWQVLRQLLHINERLKIYMIAGKDEAKGLSEVRELGAQGLLKAPFNFQALEGIVAGAN